MQEDASGRHATFKVLNPLQHFGEEKVSDRQPSTTDAKHLLKSKRIYTREKGSGKEEGERARSQMIIGEAKKKS